MRVADLMTSAVAVCAPQEPIRTAAHRMNERRCGCLPVLVDDAGQQRLVGIVTDRDLVCRAVALGLDPNGTEIARCMSFPVQTIASDADLGECAERFTTTGVRRLVVIDEQNRCQGVISRADLQRFVIKQASSDDHQDSPDERQRPATTTPTADQTSSTPTADEAGRFPATTPERGNPELTL